MGYGLFTDRKLPSSIHYHLSLTLQACTIAHALSVSVTHRTVQMENMEHMATHPSIHTQTCMDIQNLPTKSPNLYSLYYVQESSIL